MYLKKLKIGNVELENNIILAPMAGVTDRAFRTICKEYGARCCLHRNGKCKSYNVWRWKDKITSKYSGGKRDQ